ncbi:MAG: DMT family transporter [Alphaproteobacteria bacterium]|nr:DMT family transporter [Alphaproteobacteria bacterium]
MSATTHHYARAAAFALTGFTLWSISDALLKLARTAGASEGEAMLISGISGMMVLFVIAALRGQVRKLQPHKWTGLLALGICQCSAFVFWLVALPHMLLVKLYAVAFMTPMTVASLAALFLKEHLGISRATAIVVGFAGVIVALNPVTIVRHHDAWIYYGAAALSMLGTAAQMLTLRVVSRNESSECTAFYPRSVLLIAGAVACAGGGFPAMTPPVFLEICGSGALASIGWALMSQAYKNAPAAAVAPFHYSQMLTGAFLGYLIWDSRPDIWLVMGSAIIIGSGVYLILHERRASRTMIRG